MQSPHVRCWGNNGSRISVLRLVFRRRLARRGASWSMVAAGRFPAFLHFWQSAKNSTIAVLSSFFNWCMDRNLIEHSPVERVKKIKMKSRKRKLSDSEIRIFWLGCDELGSAVEVPKKKKPAAQFGPMFQLLLLTGARRTEVAEMTRDEVNFKNRTWTIPSERTKTKEEHQVYLCDTAIAILTALPRVLGVLDHGQIALQWLQQGQETAK
jgi:integrase